VTSVVSGVYQFTGRVSSQPLIYVIIDIIIIIIIISSSCSEVTIEQLPGFPKTIFVNGINFGFNVEKKAR